MVYSMEIYGVLVVVDKGLWVMLLVDLLVLSFEIDLEKLWERVLKLDVVEVVDLCILFGGVLLVIVIECVFVVLWCYVCGIELLDKIGYCVVLVILCDVWGDLLIIVGEGVDCVVVEVMVLIDVVGLILFCLCGLEWMGEWCWDVVLDCG